MEEFFYYLGLMLNMTAWMIKNYDITLGGMALIVLLLNSGSDIPKIPFILMAIIGFGIRAVRIRLRNSEG